MSRGRAVKLIYRASCREGQDNPPTLGKRGRAHSRGEPVGKRREPRWAIAVRKDAAAQAGARRTKVGWPRPQSKISGERGGLVRRPVVQATGSSAPRLLSPKCGSLAAERSHWVGEGSKQHRERPHDPGDRTPGPPKFRWSFEVREQSLQQIPKHRRERVGVARRLRRPRPEAAPLASLFVSKPLGAGLRPATQREGGEDRAGARAAEIAGSGGPATEY